MEAKNGQMSMSFPRGERNVAVHLCISRKSLCPISHKNFAPRLQATTRSNMNYEWQDPGIYFRSKGTISEQCELSWAVSSLPRPQSIVN